MILFGYNSQGERIRKFAAGVATLYTMHGKLLTHLTKGSDYMHFYYDANSRPAMVDYNGTHYTYLYNLQGDVVGLVDSANSIVVEYKYDAWGKLLSTTGTLASTLGYLNPFRYRGYIYDEETGLYYLHSRYYNPMWGRFVSADTEIGEKNELLRHNVFTYCGNMPLIIKDETGRGWLFVAAVAFIGAVVGGASQVVANIATGSELFDGVVGAAVGGAVYNVVGLVTNSTAAAAFSSSAAESLTNEVIDYLGGEKNLTGENILASSGKVLIDTAVNGTIYYGTGKIADEIVPTNNGWFQPKKLVSALSGKYARKVWGQTTAQSIYNVSTNIIRHYFMQDIALIY